MFLFIETYLTFYKAGKRTITIRDLVTKFTYDLI